MSKKQQLTLQALIDMPQGKIFASGTIVNSPDGIFATRDGGDLRRVAKRGDYHDRCVYIYRDSYLMMDEFVAQYGDKVFTEEYIRRVVPCDDEAFKMYRY